MCFLVLQIYIDEEERADYFALIVFPKSCDCNLWFFLMVLWVSMQCVIVVFPDHAHLLLHVYCEAGNDRFCIYM